MGKLSMLLSFYSKRTDHNNVQESCVLNETLMTMFQHTFGITTERCVSSLSFHVNCTMYYSLNGIDEMFGASGNTYEIPWEGSSVAIPIYTSAAMNTALKFAVCSAMLPAPSFTVLVLPARSGSAYYKWLEHPYCYLIAKIPKGNRLFSTANHWTGAPTVAEPLAFPVNVIAVCNPRAWTQYDLCSKFTLCQSSLQ